MKEEQEKRKKLQKKNNSIIRNRNVVQKLREGDSIFSVALKFGLSESSVRALSSQTGAHREAVAAKELRAIEMLRQGKKYKEIAKELGLTESKIKILSSKSSAHSEYLRDRNNKVLELYEDGRYYIHTGDLGYIDEDGVIFFVQRMKRYLNK